MNEVKNAISEIEVKKQLYKSKAMAKFSFFADDKLFYNVELEDGTYQFPLPTAEKKTITVMEDDEVLASFEINKAAADMKGATFGLEVKGSSLNRWIAKAIKSGDFIKISL